METVRSEPRVERGTVELVEVSRHFGAVTAVDGISLRVEPGEFLALLGPSGCGKTTTLRMLAGFEQPDSGTILISGASVAGLPPHKRDVNTVFQAYALFPHMTVAENIAYGLRQRRVSRADIRTRVSQALDLVQMTPMAGRKPQQLSGGQQQRVALARALINRPSVLLLDEPLGALDRKLREEMQVELKLLQTTLGITFIFVTHDQEEALAMSDRVAVMLNGHIEQVADPSSIYADPKTEFVAGFLGQQNFFRGVADESGQVVRDGAVALRAAGRTAGIASGDRAVATVRPGAIAVSAGGSAGAVNSLSGVVVDTAHLGDVVQYVIEIEAGRTALVRRPRNDGAMHERGAHVTCSWAPTDVRIFPSTSERSPSTQ